MVNVSLEENDVIHVAQSVFESVFVERFSEFFRKMQQSWYT